VSENGRLVVITTVARLTQRFLCSIDATSSSFIKQFSPIHPFSICLDFTSLFLEFLVAFFGSFGNSSPLCPHFGSRPCLQNHGLQFVKSSFSVLSLCSILLTGQGQNPILVDAIRLLLTQPFPYFKRDPVSIHHIHSYFYFGIDLINVLSTGTRRSHKLYVQFVFWNISSGMEVPYLSMRAALSKYNGKLRKEDCCVRIRCTTPAAEENEETRTTVRAAKSEERHDTADIDKVEIPARRNVTETNLDVILASIFCSM
jgi:hypothetical protein